MKRALTIAGSDSSGGAGIQADLKTFSAFGVFGASAITAVTAQNTCEVRAIHPVPAERVAEQVELVLSDIGADAIKTGMLFSREIVLAVVEVLEKYELKHLVVDPVMIAKSGAVLLDQDASDALATRLLPLCEVLTPNIPEAEALTGRRIEGKDDMRRAAEDLFALGPRNILIKGGHLSGGIVDILYDGQKWFEFESKRIESTHTHGTGCTLSAALAAGLALGLDPPEAVETARDYVYRAIQEAPQFGSGAGPLNHGVSFKRPASLNTKAHDDDPNDSDLASQR